MLLVIANSPAYDEFNLLSLFLAADYTSSSISTCNKPILSYISSQALLEDLFFDSY